MALPGDREWESQLALDTYKLQSSLEGDVDGAAREVDTYEMKSNTYTQR